MNLYEVIRWGNESGDPVAGGPDGADTCFLVRAESVKQAAALADRELSLMPNQRVASWAAAAYLLGSELGSASESQLLRGPYVQHAYRHGWRHWYREEQGGQWAEKPLGT